MPKLNDEKLLIKEPYRSILILLTKFSYLNGARIGLQHSHFLYALRNNTLKMNAEKEKEAREFFDRFSSNQTPPGRIHNLYTQKKNTWKIERQRSYEVHRGCIKRPQRLNDALVLLIRKKWVEVNGEPRYRWYSLSRAYWMDLERRRISFLLGVWDHNTIITGESLYQFYLQNPDGFTPSEPGDMLQPPQKSSDFLLCGVSMELIKELSNDEKKNLNDWLLIIETNLWNVMELKFSKTKKSIKRYIKDELDGKVSTEDLIRSSHIGFYYTARKGLVHNSNREEIE